MRKNVIVALVVIVFALVAAGCGRQTAQRPGRTKTESAATAPHGERSAEVPDAKSPTKEPGDGAKRDGGTDSKPAPEQAGVEGASSTETSSQLTAKQVLEKMAITYKSLKTLDMQGTLYASMSLSGKNENSQGPISLKFARPNKIRLVTGDGKHKVIIVSDGKKMFAYMPEAKMYQESPAPKKLSDAPEMGGMGLSTPSLLDGRDITPFLNNAKLLPSEKVGGVDSYVIGYSISSKGHGSSNERIWIGKKDYLIRQIKTSQTLSRELLSELAEGKDRPPGPLTMTQKTVARTVVANSAIPGGEFKFVPPAGVKKYEPPKAAKPSEPKDNTAPDISMPALDGRKVSLADYRGKPVLVVFWTTLSKTARQGMVEVQKLHEEIKGSGIAIIGISLDGDKAVVSNYVKENAILFPILFDRDKAFEAASGYGLTGVPTIYVVGGDGKIKARIVGPQSAAEIKSHLKSVGIE